jgi:hypothetical protein
MLCSVVHLDGRVLSLNTNLQFTYGGFIIDETNYFYPKFVLLP